MNWEKTKNHLKLKSLALLAVFIFFYYFYKKNLALKNIINDLTIQIRIVEKELESFKNQDQVSINNQLKLEIENIQKTYSLAVDSYENLLGLKIQTKNTEKFDQLFAQSLNLLSQRNYASAAAVLVDLNKKIEEENQKIASSFKIPENLPQTNSLPLAGGYQRQKVIVGEKSFMVDLVSADLNSTKVIVDTASESDCSDNCPVLSLAEYVTRNNAFAGINGSYFCPATYPSCANKKNAFDTLLMNKNKRYFNSDNNIYSTNPAVIFWGNQSRFVTKALEWGRDTGVDAVISNYPLLVFNSQIFFGGSSDEKMTNKGNRSFIGVTGKTVYIGVVHNATVAESAQVLYALGMNHALNLDNGGSTALWYKGYKVGPGRNIPNAILFIKK